MKKIRAAGALFLSINTNRFLFGLRSDDSYSGNWSTFGGRVELNETVIDCLRREIEEEVGYLPFVRKIVPIDLFSSEDGRFEFHTFVCIVDREFIPKLNHEHSGYAWTKIDEYPKPLHPALFNALKVPELRDKLSTLTHFVEQEAHNDVSAFN